MDYFWTKTAHLVFVMAWMGGVFYLPRILVNIAEAGDIAAVRERLVLMGRRLYRFGHMMFGFAFVFGLVLWLHFGMTGGWLHAKLALVVLMLRALHDVGPLAEGRREGPGAALPARAALVQRSAGVPAGRHRVPGAGEAAFG